MNLVLLVLALSVQRPEQIKQLIVESPKPITWVQFFSDDTQTISISISESISSNIHIASIPSEAISRRSQRRKYSRVQRTDKARTRVRTQSTISQRPRRLSNANILPKERRGRTRGNDLYRGDGETTDGESLSRIEILIRATSR